MTSLRKVILVFIAALAVFVAFAAPVSAHPFDEINHLVNIDLDRKTGALEVEYAFYLGGQYMLEWAAFDTEGDKMDNILSPSEKAAWTELVRKNIRVSSGDVLYSLEPLSSDFPLYDEFVSGKNGLFKFKFRAKGGEVLAGNTDWKVSLSSYLYDKSVSSAIKFGWRVAKSKV